MYTAVDNGIIGGYPDSTLKPYEKIIYAEAAKILFNATGQDYESYNPPSAESGNEWYWKYMSHLEELSSNGNLDPGANVSKAGANKMIDDVLSQN